MIRISLGLFLLTSLYASTWEEPYTCNFIVCTRTLEWENASADRYHLNIYASGLANLSTFTPWDSGLLKPLPVFLIFPELVVNTGFKPIDVQISVQQIISAEKSEWETDSVHPKNSLYVYRFCGEVMWQPLEWLGVSTGYIHYLGYRRDGDSFTLDQASSFSIGALFEPGKNLKLGFLTQAPAKLNFKRTTDSGEDTLKLPLIVSAQAMLSPTDKFDIFTTVRYSQVFTKTQDVDSTGDFLRPFGFGAGADFKPIPSVNLRFLGDYSASSLYPLEPLWPAEQGLVIAIEGSWRKGPWVFSALLASGRHFTLDKASGFDSDSYILRLGAAFEL